LPLDIAANTGEVTTKGTPIANKKSCRGRAASRRNRSERFVLRLRDIM